MADVANISLRFKREGKFTDLEGYLSDDGISLSLTHEYANALELAGSLVDQWRKGLAGLDALSEVLPDWTGLNTKINSYIDTGVVLNAPYFWQGTNPIKFTISMFQIATRKSEIIEKYQEVLIALSPKIDGNSGETENDTQSDTTIKFTGSGPSTVDVHYFPEGGKGGMGRIKFLNCFCNTVDLKIEAPYDKEYSPIIGRYTFQLQTARLVDSVHIANIFKLTEKT